MLQLLEISARDDQGFLDEIVCISRIASKYLFLRAKVLYWYGVAWRDAQTPPTQTAICLECAEDKIT